MLVTWEVEAIELGLLDHRYELIKLGNIYKVDNQFLYDVEKLQVIEKKIDILAPQKINLTIGSKKKKLTDYQREIKDIQSNLMNVKAGINAGNRSLVDLINNYDNINKTIANQSLVLDELTIQTGDLTVQLGSLDANVTEYQEQTSITFSQFKQVQEEHKNSIADLLDRVAALENKK